MIDTDPHSLMEMICGLRTIASILCSGNKCCTVQMLSFHQACTRMNKCPSSIDSTSGVPVGRAAKTNGRGAHHEAPDMGQQAGRAGGSQARKQAVRRPQQLDGVPRVVGRRLLRLRRHRGAQGSGRSVLTSVWGTTAILMRDANAHFGYHDRSIVCLLPACSRLVPTT